MSNTLNHRTITTSVLNTVGTLIRVSVELIRESLQLLLGSTAESSDNRKTENASRGGAFNYRTYEFDNGTDPCGWYDHK